MKRVFAVFRSLLAVILVLLLGCLTGCKKQETSVKSFDLDAYVSGVNAQAAVLMTELEQESLTQIDMNEKSKNLADLWDTALSMLLAEAQQSLSAADYERLTAEQVLWEADKKAAVEAAGKDCEGGSMHALVVNSKAAKLTEAQLLRL